MTSGLLAVLLAAVLPAAEPLRVEVSRDAWISSFPTEQEGNNGGSPKLKLKGTQEFFLIDFDATKFRGKRVVRATLHLHLESSYALGRTTVSTIAQEWVEGKEFSGLQNDFESSVFGQFPIIEEIKTKLSDHGAFYSAMSGSGSSVFGLFDLNQEIDLPNELEKFVLYRGKFEF